MSLKLPPSIALYISAVNRNATQNVRDFFTEDAMVKDEGKTIHGIEEIQHWMTNTKKKYQHTIEPLAVLQEDQFTIVTNRLTGAFPGSPIEVPFKFVLRGDQIARLDIG